jgi:phosphoribosylglycinamide formyltransferase 1
MIVVLGGKGRSTNIVTNDLAQEFDVTLIREQPVPVSEMLRRRTKKLGWFTVAGQVAFMAAAKVQGKLCAVRVHAIEQAHGMDSSTPNVRTFYVDSANDEETAELLRKFDPLVVVVNGTRILSEGTLKAVAAPFINTHAGITPKYRGVHGAYWALVRNDAENAGVTVHLVDTGIDTGGVLYQARVKPASGDCFSTYPTLQLAAALPLLKQAVHDALANRLRVIPADHPSQLFHHPTIWQYLAGRLRGVR